MLSRQTQIVTGPKVKRVLRPKAKAIDKRPKLVRISTVFVSFSLDGGAVVGG